MSIERLLQFARGLLAASLVGAAALVSPAIAQDDPPGRVGRVADLGGDVSWFDAEQGQWAEAERNRPLTGGDRIGTGVDGRAELRIGSTVLRLSSSSELEVLRLDDEKLVFQLHRGSLALRVRSREIAEEVELVTVEARLLPQRAGHYRVDRIDDTTLAAAWRGELRVADTPWQVVGGQRIELVRENRGAELRQAPARMADDAFADWVLAEDGRDNERTASNRYVSPEMTGAEELDQHGRWDQHPEYGAIWVPSGVRADWAPYRYGRWAWVQPWGWSWVDDAPWGFAPFHYGRWVHWRNRWGWTPGAYVARPVYAPALVAWVGGPHLGFSVRIGGGPAVGWVPLAPREAYSPHYRHTPRYVDRVNPGPRQHWQHPQHPNPAPGRPGERHDRPWSYGNQAVPGAVTVVPRDVLARRQPVARAVIDVHAPQRPLPGAFLGPQRPIAQLAPADPPGPPVLAPRGERGDREQRRDDRHDARPEPWSRPPPQAQAPTLPAAPSAQPIQRGDGERGGRHVDRDGDRPRWRQPGFGAERPLPRQETPAFNGPGRIPQPAAQAPAPRAPLAPPLPQAAPQVVERAGPPPRAAVPLPPPAAAAVATPPAVVRAPPPPPEPPRPPREDERRGRPDAPQRAHTR